jgi:eukaryotic-like serine/threonine-protein kinase
MALAAGTRLGPYEILSPLGAGGMGEVYRARDTRLDRSVAIKILPTHLSSNPELRARFEQETKSISALQHPNICVLHDVGTQDGLAYMVMEYVAGKTLDKLIPPGGMPPEVAVKNGLQIAEALARAHASGIVHRDLKPSNIMVDDTGLVKVLDFGLAKLSSSSSMGEGPTVVTSAGMIVGTAAYMSPEQAEGHAIDARSDVFSFGSVFYQMLTGKKAFEGPSSAALLAAIMRDEPRPVSEFRRDVPPEVRRIVTRCLKKDPEARYASAAELARELKITRDMLYPESGSMLTPERLVREAKRPWALVALALIVSAIATTGALWIKHAREVRWAREVALPQISAEADTRGRFGDFGDAFAMAERAEKAIPGDPTLEKLWPLISYRASIESTPPGADLYRRIYADPSAPWEFVGRTPVDNLLQPRGTFVWKLEKQGYASVLRTTPALFGFFPVPIGAPVEGRVTLDATSAVPPGMVRVSTDAVPKVLRIPGYEGLPEIDLKDYWIDRYEVTNRQFKNFLDQGGYQKQEYWKAPFSKDGKRLSWEEAMSLFKDAAGRPGPKDWIQGEYPKGQDDYPVTGVSWYEAAAYAEFSGKTLPTIYHWNRAAGPTSSAAIVPVSNFGTNNVVPVGSKPGMSPFGSFDMAGNVKEWVWNETDTGQRYVLGGAWDEPNYMFIDPDAQSAFLRAANIGFRCVKIIAPETIAKSAMDPVPRPHRNLNQEKPVSDELFAAYRSLYSYDRVPLNAKVERMEKVDDDWTTEKISYTAPYGNEQEIAYLMLPTKGKPPFQTVVFFPGSNALTTRTYKTYDTAVSLDAILRSGRAVVFPIYKSTYERGDGLESDTPNMTSVWRDHVMMWTKDVSRAIDYAETRPELAHEKLAYYGYSWGAVMGGLVPAVEPRIKTCVLAVGGMDLERAAPEVTPLNFAPHIKQPVLMLNGKYDFFFPVESSQKPLYEHLGSKKDQKKHLIYETGHSIPRNELIKEMLNWFDQYLGPVDR